MKIALAFWGLTRSLKYTIKSIEENILKQLNSVINLEYTIFMHTYYFDNDYVNNRAKEVGLKLDFEEYKLLNPDFISIDNQDEVKNTLGLEQYRSKKDPWNTGYATVDNFICAMYSRKKLGQLILESGLKFDYVMFLRPDVKYLNPFSTGFFNMVNDHAICIPRFGLYSNFNDRFCITNFKNAFLYANVFDHLLRYSLTHELHSETVHYFLLHEQYKLRIIYLPFYFNRIRADGNEWIDCNKLIK